MAQTFSQVKTGLNEISDTIVSIRAKLVQSKAQIQDAAAELTAMGTKYQTFVTDIDAALAAAPADAALINAKAEKDKLVAEFTALKNVATAGIAALNV